MFRQVLLFLLPVVLTVGHFAGLSGFAFVAAGHVVWAWSLSAAAGVAEATILTKPKGGTPLLRFAPLLLLLWGAQLVSLPWLSAPLAPEAVTLGVRPVPQAPKSLVEQQGPISPIGTSRDRTWDSFGGTVQGRDIKTISVVLPCAEERENAIWTVERFCRRTPAENLQEVIVVDDGSNPPLQHLFESSEDKWAQDPQCKEKLRFLRHEQTTGLMAAKLTGGRQARGDVIAFIDCHCAPQPNWHQEILAQVRINPRRMVVPAITDLDLDTFDERADSQVNAKCYLTLDADFKWFDDESDFIPTISGGLVAMGREWFNATGGFDEEMHGWGGENLDQSLRAWLCGGDIVRAKTSRVAHMWRTGKDRRTATHYVIKAKGTNNRGRVVAAWFGPFREVSRSSVKEDQVQNYRSFKNRLHCRPFSYFLYRFRKLYIEGGVIAREYFRLQEVSTSLCLGRAHLGNCSQGGKQYLQRGNVDRDTGACCSGLRLHGTNDCFDYFDQNGLHPYSCDVMGRNMNQQYRLREDGRIQKGDDQCLVASAPMDTVSRRGITPVALKRCDTLGSSEGVFRIIDRQEPREHEIYREELAKYQWDKLFPDLPDN